MTRKRVLFWCQHLLGTGHLKRSGMICGALASRGLDVTLVRGGPATSLRMPSDVTLIDLPSLRASGMDFAALLDDSGRPVTPACWQARKDILSTVLQKSPPDIFVTEMFPFGRSAFGAELLHVIRLLKESGRPVPVVSSVRDVLVSKRDPRKHDRWLELLSAHYDAVLVHGDPALISFDTSFRHAALVADKLHYTGYVVEQGTTVASGSARRGVLVSAGGGIVGSRLIETAMNARALSRFANEPWQVMTGANTPDFDAMRAAAPSGIELFRHVDDLPRRMAEARVSVSQAGYNTAVEALAAGCEVVLVPFETESEDEQYRRARALESAGYATMVRQSALSPSTLAEAIDTAAARRGEPPSIALDGAAESARLIERMIDGNA